RPFDTRPLRLRHVPGTGLGAEGRAVAGRGRNRPTQEGLGRDFRALEMLVRRAVIAFRQRRALARLALSRRRSAARDAAVECTGLDLLLDEGDRRCDALLHSPGHFGLRSDGEVTPDVLEERPIGLREIERIPGES